METWKDIPAQQDDMDRIWEAGAEAMQKKIAKELAKNGAKAEASFVLTSSLPRRPVDDRRR